MVSILGVDPGSRKAGYGIIRFLGRQSQYVTSGVIRIPTRLSLPERLSVIYDSLGEILDRFQPDQMAIEQVFMAKNASSALKLGQARGAAIVACTCRQVPVFEYEARKVKQAIAGSGSADKFQVQHMVKTLLKLPASPQEDAADALAVALCHSHTHHHLKRLASSRNSGTEARHFRRGRLV